MLELSSWISQGFSEKGHNNFTEIFQMKIHRGFESEDKNDHFMSHLPPNGLKLRLNYIKGNCILPHQRSLLLFATSYPTFPNKTKPLINTCLAMVETAINWKFQNKMPPCLIANHCLYCPISNTWFLQAFYLVPHWYIFLCPFEHGIHFSQL